MIVFPFFLFSVSHPCDGDHNKNDCSHLCFLTPGGLPECACPNEMKLGDNGKQCEPITPLPVCSYHCHSSSVCIMASQRCDGKYDCPEHDDELRCDKIPILIEQDNVTITDHTQQKDSNDNSIMKIAIGSSIAIIIVVLVVIIAIILKRRRSRSDLRYVYIKYITIPSSKNDCCSGCSIFLLFKTS